MRLFVSQHLAAYIKSLAKNVLCKLNHVFVFSICSSTRRDRIIAITFPLSKIDENNIHVCLLI